MELKLVRLSAPAVAADAVIVFETEGGKTFAGSLATQFESGEVTGKFAEYTLVHNVTGFEAPRLLLAGSGKPEALDTTKFRKLVAGAIRSLKGKGVLNAAVALDDALVTPEYVAAAAEAAVVSVWEPDQLKSKKEPEKQIRTITLAITSTDSALDDAFEKGRAIGEALNVTRDIAVEPPNRLTPMALVDRARAVAAAAGLEIEVLDRDRMTQLGMGALLGVAQGSAEPPALIILRYNPASGPTKDNLGLVGKAVTFDTGGISIKPSDGMEKMKYDMCGGAAVIGAMQAIAKLKPAVSVTGVIPTVENMPGSKAQRPGDIVTSLSGKTIEVLNTDAEGRLILADAITYAKQIGCTHLVDAATLTGAIVVALGHSASGVYTNNDALLASLMEASKQGGEPMWHMPLFEEYLEQLKCVYADLQNIGTRWGGANTAAMFLKEFVGDTPWVHIDCAGTAWLDDGRPYMPKGPTGVPLVTFVNLALNWK
ncbi:MAG: Leucyl aminopeptidase [Bryobacterales bacterium]|nr:Leucyl aminopeptidase [Bryobacterales bacterium]